MKVAFEFPVVVARKGVKGFFKTRMIDEQTTVVDSGLPRLTNPIEVVKHLLAKKSPVRYHYTATKGEDIKPNNIIEVLGKDGEPVVIKYIENGNIVTNYRGEDKTVYMGVFILNKNRRVEFKISEDLSVCRIKVIRATTTVYQEEKPGAIVVSMPINTPNSAFHGAERYSASG